jgi:hypothetical protein
MEDKTLVAVVGIASVAAIEIANIIFVGIDSSVLSAVIGAITFIAGLAYGIKKGAE